jgi:hypothetical protein
MSASNDGANFPIINLPATYHPANTDEDCIICQGNIRPGTGAGHVPPLEDPQSTTPLHIAHKACLLTWFKSHKKDVDARHAEFPLEEFEEIDKCASCVLCNAPVDEYSIEKIPIPLKERVIQEFKFMAEDVFNKDFDKTIGLGAQAVLAGTIGMTFGGARNPDNPLAIVAVGIVSVAMITLGHLGTRINTGICNRIRENKKLKKDDLIE